MIPSDVDHTKADLWSVPTSVSAAGQYSSTPLKSSPCLYWYSMEVQDPYPIGTHLPILDASCINHCILPPDLENPQAVVPPRLKFLQGALVALSPGSAIAEPQRWWLLNSKKKQLICSLSHYLQGFIHPRWCRISSINSREKQTWCSIVDSNRVPFWKNLRSIPNPKVAAGRENRGKIFIYT